MKFQFRANLNIVQKITLSLSDFVTQLKTHDTMRGYKLIANKKKKKIKVIFRKIYQIK